VSSDDYIDIEDLASAIASYGRGIRDGQVAGFARIAQEFMPDWNNAKAERFVIAASRSSR